MSKLISVQGFERKPFVERVKEFVTHWLAAEIPKIYLKQQTEWTQLETSRKNKDDAKFLAFLEYLKSNNIEPKRSKGFVKYLIETFERQVHFDWLMPHWQLKRDNKDKKDSKAKPSFVMHAASITKWKKINDQLQNSWGKGRLFETPKVEWTQEGGKATLLLFIQELEPYLIRNVGRRWDYTFAAEFFVLKNGDKTKKITVKSMYDVPKLIKSAKPDGDVDKMIKKFQKELHQLLTSLRNVS